MWILPHFAWCHGYPCELLCCCLQTSLQERMAWPESSLANPSGSMLMSVTELSRCDGWVQNVRMKCHVCGLLGGYPNGRSGRRNWYPWTEKAALQEYENAFQAKSCKEESLSRLKVVCSDLSQQEICFGPNACDRWPDVGWHSWEKGRLFVSNCCDTLLHA